MNESQKRWAWIGVWVVVGLAVLYGGLRLVHHFVESHGEE